MRYTSVMMNPPTKGCLPRELATSPVFLLGRLGYELKRHAIEELEDAGFSFYDYSVLSLAAEGSRELTRLRAIVKGIEEEFLAPLDADDRAELHKLLVRLASYHDARFALPAEAAAVT